MNQKIREYAQVRNVKLWQIAEKLGLHDSNFSRKLRHELTEQETNFIMGIIDAIADKQAQHNGNKTCNTAKVELR